MEDGPYAFACSEIPRFLVVALGDVVAYRGPVPGGLVEECGRVDFVEEPGVHWTVEPVGHG